MVLTIIFDFIKILRCKNRLYIVCLFWSILCISQESTIILVRHADPTFPPYEESPPNPRLNATGEMKALALKTLLDYQSFDFIFSTDFHRTRERVKLIAEKRKVPIEVYDPRQLDDFSRKLKKLKEAILVIGHSNSTTDLVRLLKGNPGKPIDENEFDRVYILQLCDYNTFATVLKYGNIKQIN